MQLPSVSRRRFLALSGAAAAQAALARSLFADEAAPASPAAGNTMFALDLYGQLRKEPGNVFLSPFSISTALAMTAAGAKGQTLVEMLKVLRLTAAPHAAFGELLNAINRAGVPADKRGYELTTANAIWAQKGYPWRPEFVDLTRKHYGAGVIETDFRADPEAARKQINEWAEKETREKIKDLIPPGVIDRLTAMVLTNAIYFKSAWLSQFAKGATQDQPFTRADGTKADVPLMRQQRTLAYAEEDGLQVLELPYKNNELAMVVVLPRKPDGLARVEDGLTEAKLTGWAKAVRPTLVRAFLPRFKVETDYRLVPALKALGMRVPFNPGAADFSGMHTGPEKLAISDVIHKAFVAVDEEGTEAAAATAVVMLRASAPPKPQEPKEFRADRPFLFLIRENKTGSVLFMGRFAGPSGK
jgi:serpin B